MSLKNVSYEAFVFSVFSRNQEKRSHWPGGQSAPRLSNRYNLCPCARPAQTEGATVVRSSSQVAPKGRQSGGWGSTAVPEDNRGLEGKINGQALGAALRLCLCGSYWRAQILGVSESAAVAAGRKSRDRLSWGKHATTLVTLNQFKSQSGFNAL